MDKKELNKVLYTAAAAVAVGAALGVVAVKLYQKNKDRIEAFEAAKKEAFLTKKIAFDEKKSEFLKKRKEDFVSQIEKLKLFGKKSQPIVLDIDGDGTPDAVAMDTTGDGQIDTVAVDTTGDGEIDTVLLDSDGDGEIDTKLNVKDISEE